MLWLTIRNLEAVRILSLQSLLQIGNIYPYRVGYLKCDSLKDIVISNQRLGKFEKFEQLTMSNLPALKKITSAREMRLLRYIYFLAINFCPQLKNAT